MSKRRLQRKVLLGEAHCGQAPRTVGSVDAMAFAFGGTWVAGAWPVGKSTGLSSLCRGSTLLPTDSHLHAHILTHLPTFLHTHGLLSVVLTMRCPPPDEETLRLSQEAMSPQTHRGSVAKSDQHLSAPFRSERSYPNLARRDLGIYAGMLLNLEAVACPLPVWPPPASSRVLSSRTDAEERRLLTDSTATNVELGRPFPICGGRIMASQRCPCTNPWNM